MIEIEQKYHVDSPDQLHDRLMAAGAVKQSTQQHADTYYNHPSRDFAETHEALRIRRCDGVPMVTYKGKKLPGKVKARQELEWRLDPGDPDGNHMELLLTSLGFKKVATVRKTRRNYQLDHGGAQFALTIDDVESLSTFAEIELVIPTPDAADQQADVEVARQRIIELAPHLGLQQTESRSYLRMLLESSDNVADA